MKRASEAKRSEAKRCFENMNMNDKHSLECKKSELAPPFWQPILDPCTIPAKVRTTLDKTHIFPDIWQKNTYLSRYLAKNTYLSRYLAKQQFFLSRPTLQNQLCTLFYTSKRCFWKRFLFLCFLGNSRVFFVF